MLQHLFNCSGKKSFLVGNIGIPVFEILEKISEESIIIHEFSSHQLEKITVGPRVAVLLNLFHEHLDYYENKEKYFHAKKNIFKCDNFDNYISIENVYFVKNDQKLEKYNLRKNKYFFNKYAGNVSEKYLEKIQNISVHNDTIRVAKIISDIYTLFETEEEFITNVNNFISLPHRLEIVDMQSNKNILYINDSISTIPESTIQGIIAAQELEKIKNKKLETIILGGFDRGVCLEKLIDFVLESEIKNIFLIAQTGKNLEKKFKEKMKNIKFINNKNIIYKEKLEDIMPFVIENSSHNSICLFSPSASSLDQYTNFEERGNHFKLLARTIEKKID